MLVDLKVKIACLTVLVSLIATLCSWLQIISTRVYISLSPVVNFIPPPLSWILICFLNTFIPSLNHYPNYFLETALVPILQFLLLSSPLFPSKNPSYPHLSFALERHLAKYRIKLLFSIFLTIYLIFSSNLVSIFSSWCIFLVSSRILYLVPIFSYISQALEGFQTLKAVREVSLPIFSTFCSPPFLFYPLRTPASLVYWVLIKTTNFYILPFFLFIYNFRNWKPLFSWFCLSFQLFPFK